jgi:hypothetical protein
MTRPNEQCMNAITKRTKKRSERIGTCGFTRMRRDGSLRAENPVISFLSVERSKMPNAAQLQPVTADATPQTTHPTAIRHRCLQ